MITHKDIELKEVIGKDGHGDAIYHILTKGGLSIIAKIKPSGTIKPLAQASHPAIARHQAQLLDKSLQYEERLFKSEGSFERFAPEKAFQNAVWHAQMAGKTLPKPEDDNDHFNQEMSKLYHVDAAIKNFQASGVSHSKAKELLSYYANTHDELKEATPRPHDQMALEDAYFRSTGKEYPLGVHSTYKVK